MSNNPNQRFENDQPVYYLTCLDKRSPLYEQNVGAIWQRKLDGQYKVSIKKAFIPFTNAELWCKPVGRQKQRAENGAAWHRIGTFRQNIGASADPTKGKYTWEPIGDAYTRGPEPIEKIIITMKAGRSGSAWLQRARPEPTPKDARPNWQERYTAQDYEPPTPQELGEQG